MEEHPVSLILVALGGLLLAVWLTGLWTALNRLSWGRIRKLDAQRERVLIARAEAWLEHRDRYRVVLRLLAFVMVALVTVSLVLWMQGTLGMAQTPVTAALCAALIAAVLLFLTETLGNGFLALHPWQLLGLSMPLVKLLYPVFFLLVYPALLTQRKLSALYEDTDPEEAPTTEDEIMSLVEQDAHEDEDRASLEDSERRMIRGIFDLDETLVKEIMTPRVDVDALPVTDSIEALKRKIVECGHSRIPIYRGTIDDIIGVIYAKDLLDDTKLLRTAGLEAILHQPLFIPETKNVSVLLDEFRQNKIHIAVVIDEYGGTAGVVTIEDILEEIVGEIRDEFDENEEELLCQEDPDGGLVVDGRVPIDQINEGLEVAISEEEDYDTVGGYVTAVLGRIPKPGETVVIDDLGIRIIDANERKVSKLRLEKRDSGSDDEAAAG